MLMIFVDGGARPNPGLGGVGIVIYRKDKQVLRACQFFGENRTNNQMEFTAVVNGLALSIQVFNCKRASLFTDSELVYGSVLGIAHPKHKTIRSEKLISLHSAFEDMLKLVNTDVYHVTKNNNAHYLNKIEEAHKLAEKAILHKRTSILKLSD